MQDSALCWPRVGSVWVELGSNSQVYAGSQLSEILRPHVLLFLFKAFIHFILFLVGLSASVCVHRAHACSVPSYRDQETS